MLYNIWPNSETALGIDLFTFHYGNPRMLISNDVTLDHLNHPSRNLLRPLQPRHGFQLYLTSKRIRRIELVPCLPWYLCLKGHKRTFRSMESPRPYAQELRRFNHRCYIIWWYVEARLNLGAALHRRLDRQWRLVLNVLFHANPMRYFAWGFGSDLTSTFYLLRFVYWTCLIQGFKQRFNVWILPLASHVISHPFT